MGATGTEQHLVQRPRCSRGELRAGAHLELQGCCERVLRVAVQISSSTKVQTPSLKGRLVLSTACVAPAGR